MKFILGKKIGMTQIFSENGTVIPVTKVIAGPCPIVQIQKIKKDNKVVTAVQLGFGNKKEWRISKSIKGHLKNIPPVSFLKNFITEDAINAELGDNISVNTFSVGDKLTVIGTSKGKGFAGVVKRHHFAGGPASHGHKDNLRMPGSIGAGGVQRVFKGMRMAGRMGGERVTVKNLEIAAINLEKNELYIKGAVPGGSNGLLLLSAEGELKILKKEDHKIEMTSEDSETKKAVEKELVAQNKSQTESDQQNVEVEVSTETSKTNEESNNETAS